MPRDPYGVLGLSRDCDDKTIRQRYRRRSLEAHPDRPGGNTAAFRELSEAFEVLSDPARRRQFDRIGFERPGENDDDHSVTEMDPIDGIDALLYIALVFVYLCSGFSGLILAGNGGESMYGVAKFHAVVLVLPALLACFDRRPPAQAQTTDDASSWRSSTGATWAYSLVVAQGLGVAAGVVALGFLLGLAKALRL